MGDSHELEKTIVAQAQALGPETPSDAPGFGANFADAVVDGAAQTAMELVFEVAMSGLRLTGEVALNACAGLLDGL